MSGEVFHHETPIAFGDVDYARILYFPRLFHYCHEAMEAFFARAAGIPYERLLAGRNIGFPTVHTEADYAIPMPYGATLSIEVSVTSVGTSSVGWRYRVVAVGDARIRAEARTTVVCVAMDTFQKQPVPDDLRAIFGRFLPG